MTAIKTLVQAAEQRRALDDGLLVSTPPVIPRKGRVAKGSSNRFTAAAAAKKAKAVKAADVEAVQADEAPASAVAGTKHQRDTAVKKTRAPATCGNCGEPGHRAKSSKCKVGGGRPPKKRRRATMPVRDIMGTPPAAAAAAAAAAAET